MIGVAEIKGNSIISSQYFLRDLDEEIAILKGYFSHLDEDSVHVTFNGKTFDPIRGFFNSLIISSGSTVCTIYFSTLTAYALVAYNWKLRNPFFTFILCVMMIPAQITSIGFYQFMYKIHMTNNFLALILPAIAAPQCVFFMRQFMLASLPLELLDSARIDGSREFNTFNRISLPIMKPAMATQGIFSFVFSWNQLFLPGEQKVSESLLKQYNADISTTANLVPVDFRQGAMSFVWSADKTTALIENADITYVSSKHGTTKLSWNYSDFQSIKSSTLRRPPPKRRKCFSWYSTSAGSLTTATGRHAPPLATNTRR